jgi:SAM-dependent methyltransferase
MTDTLRSTHADATTSIRDEWTRLSDGWEQQRGYMREATQPVHDWLIEHLMPSPGEAVLEIGAGPGDTGFVAAPRLGANGKLVSTDISPAMVDVARRRAQELGVGNAEFHVVDAQAMPFSDATFDGVICRWGYMLMPDPAAALRETRRVLRPSGRLALAVFTGPSENPWAAVPSRLLVQRGHVPPPTPGTPGIMALGDRDRLEALLRDAGFGDTTIEPLGFSWSFPDLAGYWMFLLEITALGPTLQRLSAEAREALRAELWEQLGTFRQGDRISIPARCWMALARR